MKHLLARIALFAGVAIVATLVFAGGLILMNVRADWALVLGGLVCVAAPILGVVVLTRMLSEGKVR
jgi:FtsH-binding integral membrane protein